MGDMKRIAVLGSTGSIGRATLEVIAAHPDKLRLVGIAARSRIGDLAAQAAQFAVPLVAVWEEAQAQAYAAQTGRRDLLVGPAGLLELATHPDVDVLVVASPPSASNVFSRVNCRMKMITIVAGQKMSHTQLIAVAPDPSTGVGRRPGSTSERQATRHVKITPSVTLSGRCTRIPR